MADLVFANNWENKRCCNCVHGTKMITDGDFLCRKGNGIVREDYRCRKFSVNVLSLGNKRRHLHNLEKIEKVLAEF